MTTSQPRSVSEPRTLVTHPELRSHHSFPTFKALGEPPKNALEKFLSLFADVRAGEGVGALLLTMNVFVLLAAYYLLKPAREGLILIEAGAVKKVQWSAVQAVLLIGIVPLFGWLASHLPRMRLIATTSVFFAANLLVFFLLGRVGVREGAMFYIWVGIFNVFIVSQFWAFANDIYTEGQGRRLFPMIGVGASLGAWLGSQSVPRLIEDLQFTPYTLMICAAALVLLSLVITLFVNRRERSAEPAVAKMDATPLGREGGFELIAKDRYLLWIALLTILLNVVNTTGEFLLGKLVEEASLAFSGAAAQKQYVTAFYGSFYAWTNLVGFLAQLFLTSRAIRFMGVRGALFILPVLAFVNYAVIAVVPLLAIVRIGKVLENSTDYSIQNTLRQALFLPTSREAKYKAKTAIDTVCQRVGDVGAAGLATAGTALGLGVAGFGWINVGLTGVWLFIAGRLAREHRRRTI
jgi:AAA family ATP:ADP antiporter